MRVCVWVSFNNNISKKIMIQTKRQKLSPPLMRFLFLYSQTTSSDRDVVPSLAHFSTHLLTLHYSTKFDTLLPRLISLQEFFSTEIATFSFCLRLIQ